MGVVAATGLGVGAIVGGGILALSGVAFAVTGPSALLAFFLNGVIAFLTASSFAEVSSKFPQSGGTYLFAKKVLSVEAAFMVGWVVWFASIVAAVLYAIGFAQFGLAVIEQVRTSLPWFDPDWLVGKGPASILAIGATLFYVIRLTRGTSGGGQLANLGKIIVFAILIVCGLWVACSRTPEEIQRSLSPFFARGVGGLFQAMGYTFIALQGFDLVAAVAGEIKDPEQTIPRAMLGSLGIALLIYLPLLFVICVAGMPPEKTVTSIAAENPETVVALAAENYLGRFGFFLVLAAGILSMLSALQANLYAASRVAHSMARDGTLPKSLSRVSGEQHIPRQAVVLTGVIVVAIVVLVPDVAAAGAASSLIFLVTFALAHWIAVLVRQRSLQRPPPFRTPFFPLVPVAGGAACLALSIYQGISVPSAGVIATIWLVAGVVLFLWLFARRARLLDASSAARDPETTTLRGLNPLVLVPIARPASASGLVAVAQALAPPQAGRVLMLSVVVAPKDWNPEQEPTPLANAQSVIAELLRVAAHSGNYPETLATVAEAPWPEILRVARLHRCQTLVLGLTELETDKVNHSLELLMNQVDCDVVVLRAPRPWHLSDVQRILIPTRGRGGHDRLLARLLGSLTRTIEREITFLTVVPEGTSSGECRRLRKQMAREFLDLCPANADVQVAASNDVIETITTAASGTDLVILGIQRFGKRRVFGQLTIELARRLDCPILLICNARK
ncbi:MAG: amino acid transporter [Gemmatales bacterium]|nr:MAG: amino acid transporter [Gemmatales bacterium]